MPANWFVVGSRQKPRRRQRTPAPPAPLSLPHPSTRAVSPGMVHAPLGAEDDLMRIVNALRKERPDIAIHVQADAGFGLRVM